eukprot:CCRYP_015762-RB/>CCRYP_015762-RB protein AED:0.23 eAED:0.23 QI:0/-1/0/1/-1/0/1/0/451
MESVLSGIDDADVYIDDIGTFSQDWDHHIQLHATILRILQEKGFTINPLKCKWAVQETDWLGYWLTPQGLKPWKKKIEAILHMDCPCNATELCMFIGCVNYYHDMWPSRAHILKPLTEQSGLKKRTPKTDHMQQAFDKMHALMAANILVTYPDHNKSFDIYTDASDFQLGACIIQGGWPVAHFSQKLSKSQQNYTEMEKEMLSIVATLEEFRGMLLGADIHVFTDHKNLTFDTLKTQRVSRWHNKVQEYSPTLHYIEQPRNILADNLSRLHRLVTPAQITEGKSLVDPAVDSDDYELYFLDQEYAGFNDDELKETLECYLNLLEISHPEHKPLNYAHIREQQQQDNKLLALQTQYPNNCVNLQQHSDVEDIIFYKKHPTQGNSKIALPDSIVDDTVQWFCQVMGHPGGKRLTEALRQQYHNSALHRHIEQLKCSDCQKNKISGHGYGLLPE